MNRRKFFKNLFGATAAAAIAPNLLAQIEEYEYVVEEKPRSEPITPEQVFAGGEGLWVFQDGKLVAWSALHGVSINWEREIIEVPHDYSGGWKEFMPGQAEMTFDVENLNINNINAFENGRNVQLITKMSDGKTMTTDGIWITYTTNASLNEKITHTGRFKADGETMFTYD